MPAHISIITPWLDHPEFIAEYEQAVGAPGVEVIVIDNGSARANAKLMREMIERLGGTYIRNEVNNWFAGANNQGLAVATGRIILFLNNDVAGDPAWLDQVRADVAPGGLYGPVLLSMNVEGTIIISHEGWCVAGLREVWELLGGWDAELHSMPYGEDRDLGLRATRAGLRLVQTDWPIQHKGRGTSVDVPGFGAGHERIKHNLIARVTGSPTIGKHPLESEPPTLESGTQLLREGYLPEAERVFARLMESQPHFADGWERYAEVLHVSGRHEAAAEALGRAVALRPESLPLRINLGTVLARAGHHAQAAAVLQEVADRAPDSAEAHANLSRALCATGDFVGSEMEARRALACRPGFGPAFTNLSNALRELGRIPEAIEAGISATAALPKSAAALNALGGALRAAGRLGESLATFQRALQLANFSPVAKKNVEELALLLNQTDPQ